MSTLIDVLYHWAPTDRREEILREGLRVYSDATVTSGDHKWPYLCLSTRPSMAWGLSGDFLLDVGGDHIDEWDLWEVRLPPHAEVHVRPFWGTKIEEVKSHTSIPADHVWFVGQRQSTLSAIKKTKSTKKSTRRKADG